MTLYGLFLDDERTPQQATWMKYPENVEWSIARNSKEFLANVSSFKWDLISFDNDLGEAKEGRHLMKDLCEWLEAHRDDYAVLPKVFVHSMNPVANSYMLAYWENWSKHVWNAS